MFWPRQVSFNSSKMIVSTPDPGYDAFFTSRSQIRTKFFFFRIQDHGSNPYFFELSTKIWG
jgi:hypothetical protein